MRLEGEKALPGPPDRVWEILLDPQTIASVIPGCKEFRQVGEDQYEGLIEAQVGPVSSQYRSRFTVSDKEYPRRYRLQVEGQGKGGFINGSALISLDAYETGTLMRYTGDAVVGGTIARVGQRLVESVAKMLVNQGFNALAARVEERIEG